MFWFKNLMSYRLTKPLEKNSSVVEAALRSHEFTPCSSLDISRIGFISPCSEQDDLLFELKNHRLLLVCEEKRMLPSNVVNRELNARVAALEEKEARKLTKLEKLSLKDDVISKLLPRAFSKLKYTPIWIDMTENLVHVDAASEKAASDALALLRKALGSLPVVPLKYKDDPSVIMTQWLGHNNFPNWVDTADEVKLKSYSDSEATFKKQEMDSDELKECLNSGKYVVKLKITFKDELLKFNLTDGGNLKGIKYDAEMKNKNAEIEKEEIKARFDADFLLMTSSLNDVLSRLKESLGGLSPIKEQ